MNINKYSLFSFLDEFKTVCENTERKPGEVKILYAVKYLNPPDFVEFINITKELKLNPAIVGENRVQSALEKINYVKENHPELLGDFHLMMIGPLQSNKVNKAIGIFEEIHSIDSLDLARDLNQRLNEKDKIIPVYLEVNISGEETKHGFRLEKLGEMIKSLGSFKSLKIKGLMTMAPNTTDTNKIKSVFRKLKEHALKFHLLTSMGMSHDWKIAIEAGSDMVRIGSRIFT